MLLGIALDGAGWHAAAWREPGVVADRLFSAGHWVDLARRADAAGFEFLTLEDGLGLQAQPWNAVAGRTDRVAGRLDAALVAARIAPVTSRIGLVPATSVTHTEPFHLSKSIATLDFVSRGRAGWRPQVSPRPAEAAHFGRRTMAAELTDAAVTELLDEAGDAVEVVRRLWDSWEDDAEIRDVATGRFIDRDRLHCVDFEGRFFSVRGPSITPRPPQGQPVVLALAHARVDGRSPSSLVPRSDDSSAAVRFAVRSADVVAITPADAVQLRELLDLVAQESAAAGRTAPLRVVADLVVLLDGPDGEPAAERRARLDAADGSPLVSDAAIMAGSAAELTDRLTQWWGSGVDGFRLRPAVLPDDLDTLARSVLPELARRGLRTDPAPGTLRDHLGLARPENRYRSTVDEGVPA
ncbi:LLM class flavin-dependent oxidoreductase [Nakamurella sp. YIM 132084]|uniref:LLM class flavin-dependent oxidoreductase n=2 Tax=Nakamurella leprariae TaxID=2803911 RepID=A0A938YHH3_9ACTN|nr:LLM class flavin-dependent oxidoreductase [Nakamurella leprariae]